MIRISALVVFALVVSACTTPAPSSGTVTRDLAGRALLDRDIPGLLASSRVTGVSIARIENGRVAFTTAHGLQGPGVPASADTLYNIASMTKPISAEVILRLVAQGRISLDEAMYRYWTDPDIASDERRKLLTPRLALSHQSGFPNWRYETDKVLQFKRKPGEAFGYSGEGYEYAARFTEKKMGTSFEALAQAMVFGPAGMRNTSYTRRPWFEGRIAVPSDSDGNWLSPQISDHLIASDLLYTTTDDYAKFVVSVMHHAGLTQALAAERGRVQVSRKAETCPPAKTGTCPDEVGFGLGWEVIVIAGETFLLHTGMDEGVFTLGYINTAARSGTIIFTNSARGPQIILPILDLLGKDRAFVNFLRDQAG